MAQFSQPTCHLPAGVEKERDEQNREQGENDVLDDGVVGKFVGENKNEAGGVEGVVEEDLIGKNYAER
ncbi:MAG: hypothetical protein IJV08_08960 [Bacteroidaceae bacterium]|nr:hypothetical protein [Bacteroidaceae bacterium]